jgi:GT2 family glycosyltransferase
MSIEKAAVVILNYNGRNYLEKFLPNIIRNSAPYPVYVADNGSTDDSISFLEENFESVIILSNGVNYGYAKGYNLALSKIEAEYYILLNSDVEVTVNWILPILELMDRQAKIAACQPRILDYKKRSKFEYAGAAGGFIDAYGYPFCRGRIFNVIEYDKGQYNEACETFWASGAALFLRSNAFKKVGGFDDSYFAHMEEIDLCWRLKNFGYQIYIQPSSTIYHIGGGTLHKASRHKTFLNFRNNLTTLTKNHPSKYLFLKIVFRMLLDGVAAYKFLFSGQVKHFLAVMHAHFDYYYRLPSTLKERKRLIRAQGFAFNLLGMYKGNIVFEHFLKKKKRFVELKKGFC